MEASERVLYNKKTLVVPQTYLFKIERSKPANEELWDKQPQIKQSKH